MALGDSKTVGDTPWLVSLLSDLNANAEPGWTGTGSALGGSWVDLIAPQIGTVLNTFTPVGTVTDVLCNWGVNDVDRAGSDETTFRTNYGIIIDAIHAKWPAATIRLTIPWKDGEPAGTFDTLAGYIGSIVADHAPYTVLLDDERVWLKGSDNGASETVDGIHYSALGMSLAARAKREAMGY